MQMTLRNVITNNLPNATCQPSPSPITLQKFILYLTINGAIILIRHDVIPGEETVIEESDTNLDQLSGQL